MGMKLNPLTGNFDLVSIGKGRGATLTVAASDATALEKAQADYICDGTADEAEINTAITAANAANGGTVHLTSGEFIINTSILPLPNANIVGEGYGTHLNMTRTDLSRAVISINPNSTQGGSAALDTIIDYNIIIRDLRIEGAGKTLYGTLPNQRGIFGYCAKGITIQNCYVSDTSSSGIALQQCPEYKISHCTVHDVGYNCIGNGEQLAKDCIVTDNLLYNSGVGFCGIEVNGSDKIIVANNVIYGCSYGVRCFSGSEGVIGRDIVISSNYIYNCGLRGIYILNTYEVNVFNNNVKHITGGITSVTVTDGGSGYSNNPTISIATGAGSGADLTANLTGGVITSVTVNSGGSGYVLADLIVTGATGQGAILKPTITAGAIASVEVINGGASYTSPVITVSPGVGGGFEAVATVVAGEITAITVTNSGYGYPASASVVVTITDGTGTGATATAVSATSGYGGIDLENATRCTINGNEIAFCASNGIYLQRSTWNAINSNTIHDNRLIDTSSDGIKLADKNSIASSYNSFVGNKCYDTAWYGASRQRYGINLIGAADYNNIIANDLQGNQTGAFGNTSTGTANTIRFNNGSTTNTDYNAHSILYATTDDTPAVLTVGEQTIVGRITDGNITALTVAQLQTLLLSAALPENVSITLDTALSADGKYSGITEAGTAGAALAFGDIVYLAAADSRWELAKADVAATSSGKIGICVLAAASDGDATTILLHGKVRADTAFPALTIGAPAYISAATAGDITATAPSGTTDFVVRSIGYGNTADELYFKPDNFYLELV